MFDFGFAADSEKQGRCFQMIHSEDLLEVPRSRCAAVVCKVVLYDAVRSGGARRLGFKRDDLDGPRRKESAPVQTGQRTRSSTVPIKQRRPGNTRHSSDCWRCSEKQLEFIFQRDVLVRQATSRTSAAIKRDADWRGGGGGGAFS